MSEYTCLQCTQDCHGESARQADTIARQARTIRRLRALADGYRLQRDATRHTLKVAGPPRKAYQDQTGEWSAPCTLCGSDPDEEHTWLDCIAAHNEAREIDGEIDRDLERARIVAALRAKVCANTSTHWDREATALGIVADAIERGEL